MKKNVGDTDKGARIIIGVIIAIAGLYFKSWWGMLALIPFVTAFTGICPLYSIFGANTCKTKTAAK
ncbi:MAG: DUF2892 domain-containing protein [Sphingobacteriales bacterium]|nr:DUF2892 domain-containing protein [Sphingobacteriales bacterium]OJY92642.1 MAG: hypothetical protein BGP14_15160 [Sphingobacteriales bacterium 44-15]